MAEEFQFRLVTPLAAVVDQPVIEVTAPGTLGEFGVLPNHANLLSTLEVGRLTYKDARGQKTFAIREGFAEVSDNVMTVLAEGAIAADDIDPAQTRADLAAAEAELATLSPTDPGFIDAELRCRWAEARLAVAAGK
ncbi:MAG: ATP synthase F1 subunit epsilon [Candidatus Binatia bacterium]